jgi:hypothetical protein
MIRHMIGRELKGNYTALARTPGAQVLKVHEVRTTAYPDQP